MASPDTLRYTRIPLADGSGAVPAEHYPGLVGRKAASVRCPDDRACLSEVILSASAGVAGL